MQNGSIPTPTSCFSRRTYRPDAWPARKRSCARCLCIDYYDLFCREISLATSYSASPAEIGEALAWIESGKLKLKELITGFCDLEGIYPAIAAMDEHSYKVIVHP